MDLRFRPFPTFLAVVMLGMLLSLPSTAQVPENTANGRSDPAFAKVHFERWAAQGPIKQISWDVEIDSPRLSPHQRMATQVVVQIPAREFFQHPGKDRLKAFVQITDARGHVYQSHLSLDPAKQKILSLDSHVKFRWGVFLLPGTYQFAIAFADTLTGNHNFIRKTVRVKPLKNDPLPYTWKGLPEVEFYGSEGDFGKAYLPEVETALNLGAAPRHPVDLHILVNVSPSERPRSFGIRPKVDSLSAYTQSIGDLLPLVKILAQLRLENVTRQVELLDVARHEVTFEQNGVHTLDWHKMKAALDSVDPNVIDVKALQDRKFNTAFVRKKVLELLHPAGAEARSGRAQVVILLSHEMYFAHGEKLPDVSLPPNCECKLYYLRMNPTFSFGYTDDINKAIRGLNPQVFSVNSPKSFRKALAGILSQLSSM